VRPRRYREINNFYTSTVYEKGAEIVRMLRTVLGADAFRAAMDLYFERHDGEAVTVEDFLKVFEDASQRDLSQFSLWYHQAGTPNVTVSTSYDQAAKSFSVEVEQSQPPTPGQSRKRVMQMPLAFGLVGTDGTDAAYRSVEGATVENGVIQLRKRRHVVKFAGVEQRPVLSINRGFSAPVTLSIQMKAQDRLFLALHDSDTYGRWQAFNGILTEEIIAAFRKLRGEKTHRFDTKIVAAAGRIAVDDSLEPAFRALALTLPGEADIAREIGQNIEPDAIWRARELLSREIAAVNETAFRSLRRDLADTQPFRPDAAGAGRRALRNVLLDYVSLLPGGDEEAMRDFEGAGNMTDRASALATLAHRHPDSSLAERALAQFETTYRDTPLVMDKWLAIQAAIPGHATVERVERLLSHPAFMPTNPNRVRSLAGTFFGANQTGFHRPDGAGYRLFVTTILAVERRNPQVAARLATALRSWRSLEPLRRDKAREALLEIAATQSLSADLRDIIERTLA
jgi:aminopeptidase N